MNTTARVPNHLAKAILVTMFFFQPTGIVALVFATQVDGKFSSGDIDGARLSSERASFWGNVSLGIGLVQYLLFLNWFFVVLPAHGIG